jgi:hypothetical protein
MTLMVTIGESIDQFVLEQLAAWEVPGCAVAAVRDGEVVPGRRLGPA